MSSTLPKPETVVVERPYPQPPLVLMERLPDSWKFSRVTACFVAMLGLMYLVLCYQPLYHTDLWGHLAYGRLLVNTHTLPGTEPFMPLATGVRFVDSAWLSQILGYEALNHWGLPALQAIHAFLITGCFALITWRIYRSTKSVLATLAAIAVFGALNWYQFLIVRPQLAGMLCFVTLLTLLSGHWKRWQWVAIPVLFALWANLHGSFVVGLGTLACVSAGRAIDVVFRTKRLPALVHDRIFRRMLMLTELATAAVLVNPYGLQLFTEVFTFSGNANLKDLVEWDPLHIRTFPGQVVAFTTLALAIAYRLSPRRVSAAEVLTLVMLGAAGLWTQRLLVWWAPVAAGCLAIHAHAAWQQFRAKYPRALPSPRASRWTVVTLGLAWIAFAYTPFGLSVIQGRQVDIKKSVSELTPVAATEYLVKNPPQGQIFNTYEWGDYLVWAGPKDLQVFVTSHAHLVPNEVWRHYMSVINVAAEWNEILDRYGVTTVVVDKQERRALISKLKDHADWKLEYEDGVAAIYKRKTADDAGKKPDEPAKH